MLWLLQYMQNVETPVKDSLHTSQISTRRRLWKLLFFSLFLVFFDKFNLKLLSISMFWMVKFYWFLITYLCTWKDSALNSFVETPTDRTSTLFVKKFCLICVVMQLFNKNWNCESNMKNSKVAFESQKEDIVMHVIFHAPAPAARRKDYALIKNLWCLPSSLWVLSRPETVLFSDGLNRDPLHRVYYFFAIMSIRKA